MHAGDAWAFKPLVDMSPAEFRDWQVLLEQRTGIVLPEQRRSFLLTHLTARMRELGIDDYATYYHQVTEGPRGAVEWSSLLDRLTVKETRFFRHPASFHAVGRHLAARIAQGLQRPLALWSVGCASGEEAYSLAIEAEEAFAAHGQPPCYGVTATDISLHALRAGRRGRYQPARTESMEPARRERYLMRLDDGAYQVLPWVAERLCFARLNVLELGAAPLRGFDVIYCQNLLIYFHRWRRHEILNHLASRLAPGGLLVIGVGEAVDWKPESLQPVADDQVLAFLRTRE